MSASRRLWARHMVILLAVALSVIAQLPAFAATPLRKAVERHAESARSAWDGQEGGLLLLIAAKRHQGRLKGPVDPPLPGGGGLYSSLTASSTEVYNPDPASFLYDPPAVWLDSTWDRTGAGGAPIDFALQVTLDVTDTATELQAQIDAAATRIGNTLIWLPSGFVSNRIRLRKHTAGTYWTYIAWTGINTAQAEGVQANKDTVASTHANAPIIQSATATQTGAVWCDPGADYTRLVGIHFRATTGSPCYRLLYLQGTPDYNTENADTTVGYTPQWMIVDRCWIDGANTSRVVNGIVNNTREFACVNSVIDGIYFQGIENHGIVGYNGPGPWKIVGNAIEAASINFLCGGAVPRIDGLMTNDIEVRRNYWFKRISWNRNDPLVFDGITNKVVKNIFELKWGNRVLVEANYFENSPYGDNQKGAFLVWKVENSISDPQNPPPGGGPIWLTTSNVTYRHNYAKNVAGAYEFQGVGFGGAITTPLHRIHHYNNVVLRLAGDKLQYLESGTGNRFSGRGMFFNNGANNITIDHETIVLSVAETTEIWSTPIMFSGPTDESDIYINNNVFAWPMTSPPRDPAARSILGDGAQVVGPPDNGLNTFNAYVSNWTFDDNLMARTHLAQVNPPGSTYVATIAACGFTDIANDNCSLAVGSPGKGICADGSDAGCNLPVILAAISGVKP